MLRAGSRKGRKSEASGRNKGPSSKRSLGSKRTSWQLSEGRFGSPVKRDSRSRSGSVAVRSGKLSTPSLEGTANYKAALLNFEAATKYFGKRNYEKAAILFRKVLNSSIRELSDRAKVRLHLCEQLSRQEPLPKTAEDYYLRGVAALNSRNIEQAIEYLEKSNKMGPHQEHVQYALAAAHALQCNPDQALVHLQAAIELRPASRIQARVDEDFQLLAGDPRFERLLDAQPN